jgi:hypothetical protein
LAHRWDKGEWRELWRVDVSSALPDVELFVAAPLSFPFVLPKVFIARGEVGLDLLPHVDTWRFVCTFDEATAKPNPDLPGEVAVDCVRRAIQILGGGTGGEAGELYVDEFHHYWDADQSDLSVLTNLGKERVVKRAILSEKWAGYDAIVADGEDEARRWAANAGIPGKVRFADALLLPVASLGKPPFPKSNRELSDRLALLDPAALRRVERFMSRKSERPAHVVAAMGSGPGTVLVGWSHLRSAYPSSKTGRDLHGSIPGFRKGHQPSGFELRGYGAGTNIVRRTVRRADPERLEARTVGSGPRASFNKLCLIGAGSVGGYLAEALVRTISFSSATVCDPERFTVDNPLRHLCGFDLVGRRKADAVAAMLGRRMPNMELHSVPESALDLLRRGDHRLTEADMLVVTIGSTVIEEAIVREVLRLAKPGTPVVVAWVEPLLAAGHCVLSVAGQPGCFGCLLDENRSYSEQVVLNPADFVLSDPGCSPGYTPYGGADLTAFTSTAAGMVARTSDSGPWTMRWTGELSGARAAGAEIRPGARSFEVSNDLLLPVSNCLVCGGAL